MQQWRETWVLMADTMRHTRKIIGFYVKVKVDYTEWRWCPLVRWGKSLRCCHWLCVYSWFEFEYR